MNNFIIKLDSEVGKIIGFTSDRFSHGTLWNYLPKGIYIDSIYPTNDEDIEYLLERIQTLKIRVRFTCPQKNVVHHLKEHGYFYYVDKAGTPFYANLTEKGIAAICGKLGLTPDQLIPK